MQKANPLTLFIYPRNSKGHACEEVLSRLITRNLSLRHIDTRGSLVDGVLEHSNHPNRYKNTDVVLTEAWSPSDVWNLQADLRFKAQGDWGWAGQLLVFGGRNCHIDSLNELWPFREFGGLVVLPRSTWLSAVVEALKKRKFLVHERWMQCLDNLGGLSDFWRLLNDAQNAAKSADLEFSRTLTIRAVSGLINNSNNELFLGHEKFRLLQRIKVEILSADIITVQSTILNLAKEMRSFRI